MTRLEMLEDEYEMYNKLFQMMLEPFPFDDEESVRMANPQLASGILSWEAVKNELATMPEVDARRYRLNQFVSSMNSWLPVGLWQQQPEGRPENPEVFAIERTPGWEHASIVTAQLMPDGKVATELVASFSNTNIDEIMGACMKLAKYGKTFIMDINVLADLAQGLKQKGCRVQTTTSKDLISASNNAYRRILRKELIHPRDEIVSLQMQRAVRKNSGESWRIARKDSGTDIDAAIATKTNLQTLLTTTATTFYVRAITGGTVFTIGDNGSGDAIANSQAPCVTPTPTVTPTLPALSVSVSTCIPLSP